MDLKLPFKVAMPKKITGGLLSWIAVSVLLVGALGAQFYLRSQAKALSREIAVRQQEIVRAKMSGLGQLTGDELARLQKRVGVFQRGFVNVAQVAAILDGISDQAERNGVKVVSVNSGQPEPMKDENGADFAGYGRLGIKMRVEGTTRAIAEFLRAMGQSSDRLFVVDTMTVEKPSAAGASVACDLAMSFFSKNN